MSRCRTCLLDLSLQATLEGGACPNCGKSESVPDPTPAPQPAPEAQTPVPLGPGAAIGLFQRFWTTLRDVIFRPTLFFSTNAESLLSAESVSRALTFAVIVQWLASFFNFMWRSTVGVLLQNRMNDLFRIAGDVMQNGESNGFDQLRARMIDFFFGAGAIILTPFLTVAKLAIGAMLVHAAVRFFTREDLARRQSYAATLKILSYASAPWILCVIPGFGMVLAYVLSFIAAVIGIREVYKTTTGRAMLSVSFPELLLMAFLFGCLVLCVFLAFNVLQLVS